MQINQEMRDMQTLLLAILMKRAGGKVTITVEEAKQLPVGWRDNPIEIERDAAGKFTFSTQQRKPVDMALTSTPALITPEKTITIVRSRYFNRAS